MSAWSITAITLSVLAIVTALYFAHVLRPWQGVTYYLECPTCQARTSAALGGRSIRSTYPEANSMSTGLGTAVSA